MDISDEILKKAMTRFNSAGIVAEKSGAVLILGLESTRERNLDEMAALSVEELLKKRYEKYRQIGFFAGGKQ